MSTTHAHPALPLHASAEDKRATYARVRASIDSLLEGETDWVAAMATVACELHHAFEAYVTEHGKHLGSAALADTDVATTVRHREGRTVVTDGPFVETAEIVGGYYDVDLPDLDTAIAAAALLPPSYAVEIRPTVTIDGYEGV